MKIYFIIVVISIIYIYINNYYDVASLYFKFRLLFTTKQDKFLHANFNEIFKNYKITNINSNSFQDNYKINASRNSINEYKIIDLKKEYNYATNIVKNINQNENIYNIIKNLLPHINIDGRDINIDDIIVIDLLKSKIQGAFPFIHTDIEWTIFDNSDGFQIWYLYENEEDIGNMFLFDTKKIIPRSYVEYENNETVLIRDVSSTKIIKTVTLDDIKPDIKYLNMMKGECLIFGKNLYHMSDFRKSKYRYSINFRIIIKDKDGGIPVNFKDNNCSYAKHLKYRFYKNNIEIINDRIYPKIFNLISVL